MHMVKKCCVQKTSREVEKVLPRSQTSVTRAQACAQPLDSSGSNRNLGSIFTSSRDVFRQHFYTMETLFFFYFSLVNIKEDLQSFCWIFFSVPLVVLQLRIKLEIQNERQEYWAVNCTSWPFFVSLFFSNEHLRRFVIYFLNVPQVLLHIWMKEIENTSAPCIFYSFFVPYTLNFRGAFGKLFKNPKPHL